MKLKNRFYLFCPSYTPKRLQFLNNINNGKTIQKTKSPFIE